MNGDSRATARARVDRTRQPSSPWALRRSRMKAGVADWPSRGQPATGPGRHPRCATADVPVGGSVLPFAAPGTPFVAAGPSCSGGRRGRRRLACVLGAQRVLEAAGEPVDELGDLLERVRCGGLGPAGQVRDRRRAGVKAHERDGQVRDGLGDELLFGVAQLSGRRRGDRRGRARARARGRARRPAR